MKIMDEQECIKSDVALSRFIRATLRGLMAMNKQCPPHELLVTDYNTIVKNGLNAEVKHPEGKRRGGYFNTSLRWLQNAPTRAKRNTCG